MKTIAELRQTYKVYVKHKRYYGFLHPEIKGEYSSIDGPLTREEAAALGYTSANMLAHGGQTEIELFYNGKLLASGYARCNEKDAFNRRLGLTKALGRLLGVLEMVNWNEIVEEVGQERLRTFCEGGLTRREFEQSGSASRRLIRDLGIDEVRTRARKALNRRTARS